MTLQYIEEIEHYFCIECDHHLKEEDNIYPAVCPICDTIQDYESASKVSKAYFSLRQDTTRVRGNK